MAEESKKYSRVSDVPSRRRAVPAGQTPRDTWIAKTPDGKIYTFYSADDAQNFINKNYSNHEITQGDFGLVTVPEGEDIAPFILELPAVTIVGQKPTTTTPIRRGVDMFIGANYSPSFNRAYDNLGMNPLNWPERSGLLAGGSNDNYWDSDIHKAVNEGNNTAAKIIAAPFAAYTSPTWVPWLAKAFITPKGILASSVAGTLGSTANQWLPWLMSNKEAVGIIGGTLAAIPAGLYIAENGVPSLPQFGSRSMATEATPTDSVGTASALPADTTRTTTPAPRPEGNDSTKRKPSFRERLGDWIAGRNSKLTASSNTTPPNDNHSGSFIRRLLWETRKNNFGQNNWLWRNFGRVGLYLSHPAREYVWPSSVGEFFKYMAVGPDSVPATTTPTDTTTTNVPLDGFRRVEGTVNDISGEYIIGKNATGTRDTIIPIKPIVLKRFGNGNSLDQ